MQDFLLDWDREVATCPAGHRSRPAESRLPSEANRAQSALLDDRLSILSLEGTVYPKRAGRTSHATTAEKERDTLEAARIREAQPTSARDYRQRAGIEGTISAGLRDLCTCAEPAISGWQRRIFNTC